MKYTSFLICDHSTVINYYREGIEIATYHKPTGEFQVKSDKPDDALRFITTLRVALGLFEGNFEKFKAEDIK